MGNDIPEFPHSEEVKNTLTALYIQLDGTESDLLHELAEADEPLNGTEMASRVEYSASTVYRRLDTLGETVGSVLEEKDQGYHLSADFSLLVRDFREYRDELDSAVGSD